LFGGFSPLETLATGSDFPANTGLAITKEEIEKIKLLKFSLSFNNVLITNL
jgi:hypothetical protein